MRPRDQIVAGLTCAEVMTDLSAYLDHDLAATLAAQIEAHVASCGQCAQFGASFATLVSRVRERLRMPDPIPPDIVTRLHEAVRHFR